MKLLSFAVPCYNSQDYMRNCIESLLPGGDDVEIIIVDDGSTDDTAAIADEYADKYPGIVVAIHQPNGGHGEAVNTGIKNAGGVFFKVVDSDDWVDRQAYDLVLDTLRSIIAGPETLDVMICNYVYEKEGAKRKKIMRYKSAFPQGEIFTWKDVKKLGLAEYILMHSVIYRTELLRESGLKLPDHTFYVDNLYAYRPMMYARTMYYLNVNFYRYYIGREDQSVNEQIMISRIDQQIKVNKLMIDSYDPKKLANKRHRAYMIHALSIIMAVSTVLSLKSNLPENIEKKDELWKYLKDKDVRLYHRVRFCRLGRVVNLPGKGGRQMTVAGYKLAQKIYGFN